MLGEFFTRCAGRGFIVAIFATAVWSTQPAEIARADESPPAAGPVAAPANGASPAAGQSPQTQQEHIQKLIRDLGNPRYTARRAAAAELRQIGAEAFDTLHAATEDTDPEIAASASYLLRQIAVRWAHPEDPPTVRAIMQQFGSQPEAARTQEIELLARLPKGAGNAALCRITRYDRSAHVSRTAALAMIQPFEKEVERSKVDPAQVEQELGASTRPSAMWLRQYLVQLRDPQGSIGAWKKLIEQESARLAGSKADTSNEVVLGLLWNVADLHRQAGDVAAISGTIDQMMDLAGEQTDEIVVNLLAWITKNNSWDVLDSFLSKHQARFQQSKKPLYFAALARAEQGKKTEAEELAKTAASAQSQGQLESCIAAKELEQHGQFDWAVREYHQVIDKPDSADTFETVLARIYLSRLLEDYQEFKDAADVLEKLIKSVQGEGRVGQMYARYREYQKSLPEPDELAARYHYYRAEQYMAEKDFTRARTSLETGIKLWPKDADILITMYRFPEADAKWREANRQRIRQLTDQFQQEIDANPTDASPYNQWAWLVSNTEGDFQKAIRYSHRSLELNTNGESGDASLLDTLGRCYYAAGDYENAIKYEREAIAKEKYMQVMQRQMALFEKALAEKKAGGGEQRAGSKK